MQQIPDPNPTPVLNFDPNPYLEFPNSNPKPNLDSGSET